MHYVSTIFVLYAINASSFHGEIEFLPTIVTSSPLILDYSTSKKFKLSSLPPMTSVIFLLGHTCVSPVYGIIICSTMSQGAKCDSVSRKIDHRNWNTQIRATSLPKTFTIFGTEFSRIQSSLVQLPPFSAYFLGMPLQITAITFASIYGIKRSL